VRVVGVDDTWVVWLEEWMVSAKDEWWDPKRDEERVGLKDYCQLACV